MNNIEQVPTLATLPDVQAALAAKRARPASLPGSTSRATQPPITVFTDTFQRANSTAVGMGYYDKDSAYSIVGNRLARTLSGGHFLVLNLPGFMLNQRMSIFYDSLTQLSTTNANISALLLTNTNATQYIQGGLAFTGTSVIVNCTPNLAGTNYFGLASATGTVIAANSHRHDFSITYDPQAQLLAYTNTLTDTSRGVVVATVTNPINNSALYPFAATPTLQSGIYSDQNFSSINQITIDDPTGVNVHSGPFCSAPDPSKGLFGSQSIGRTRAPFNVTTPGAAVRAVRLEHIAPCDLIAVIIGHTGTMACPDAPCPTAYSVRSSVEYPVPGFPALPTVNTPCYGPGVNGRDLLIQPGQIAKFDPVFIRIPKGGVFCTRHQLTTLAGQSYPTSVLSGSINDLNTPGVTNTGFWNGNVTSDMTINNVDSGGTTLLNTNAFDFCPAFIGGIAAQGTDLASVAVVGTSISEGTGGAGFIGWAQRAFEGKVGMAALAVGGTALVKNLKDYDAIDRRYRLGIIAGCHHLVIEHFVNETFPLGHFQANILAWANDARAMGVKTWLTTPTSRTSSTDGWTTLSGQTILTDGTVVNKYGPGGSADQYKAWMLAQVQDPTSPIFGVIDLAAAVIDTATRKWLPGMTTDGIHPSTAGHAAIAALVTAANYPALFSSL